MKADDLQKKGRLKRKAAPKPKPKPPAEKKVDVSSAVLSELMKMRKELNAPKREVDYTTTEVEYGDPDFRGHQRPVSFVTKVVYK